MTPLHALSFQNDFVNSFPGDDTGDKRPRQTPGMLYSKAIPTPVRQPELVAWSEDLAKDLGLKRPDNAKDIAILAGNLVTPSMQPYAACYAGHQFGNWAGQLGDGRAITLGEIKDTKGNPWELQLKGAGPTPYSRRADGRAVLRSSVREYLMSEAMFHLGVPTTRALSLVTTGDAVMRDMFYDGHPANEPGAIVLRAAPSFLRFGNFEMPAARNELSNLKDLVDWTIARFFPQLTGEDKVLRWFEEIVERTAFLMSEWMRVGFVHGVMNTDNMSILGLTIDYGPYSFVDEYDPFFTPNTTDLPGRRYAFGRQPSIGYWNLGCLAGALAVLLPDTKDLVAILETYEDRFLGHHYAAMGAKLGLDGVRTEDKELIADFEKLLFDIKPDMTIFYQLLIDLPEVDGEDLTAHFSGAFYTAPSPEAATELNQLLQRYIRRIKTNTCDRETAKRKMQGASPRFILRNYLLHQAIEALQNGKSDLFHQLEEAIKNPYAPSDDTFFARRPDWAAQKAGCSMLSCSS
jgi:uncharacterized protein YdiU (UPF0061 family)